MALVVTSPALALTARGHVFSKTIGSRGTKDGQFEDPSSIAVNESTGDIYVLDRASHRIQRLNASGEFISAWGWGVGGGNAYEICTSDCGAGLVGTRPYELSGNPTAFEAIAVDNCTHEGVPCTIAEDPSVGDVYVAGEGNEERGVIEKFSPEGEKLERVHDVRYLIEGKEREYEELENDEIKGFTVGAEGSVWLYYEEEIYGMNDAGLSKPFSRRPIEVANESDESEGELTFQPPGLAVDAHNHFYFTQMFSDSPRPPLMLLSKQELHENAEGGRDLAQVTPEVDGEQTFGFTVAQPAGVVYLENEVATNGGGAEFSVAAVNEAGSLVDRFGEDHLSGSGALAVDGRADSGHGVVYVAESEADAVQVFGAEESGPPRVDELSAQSVGSNEALLHGEVDPHGAPTTYQLEYGTPVVSCASEPGACTKLAPVQLAEGPDEGFGDVAVETELGQAAGASLLADTKYHYRLVASNSKTQAGHEGAEESREGTFTTRPVTIPLADEREWELVSPAHKNGAEVEPPTREGAAIQAAAGGGALAYVTDAPVAEPEGSRSLEVTQDLATRGKEGWSTKDIVTPSERGTGLELGKGVEYSMFSSDLSLAAVQPFTDGGTGSFAEPPLAPPVSAGELALREHQREHGEPERYAEKTIYLRRDFPIAPGEAEGAIYEQAGVNGAIEQNPGYVPLITGTDALPGFGSEEGHLLFIDATPDLSHVLVRSNRPLTEAEGAIPAPRVAPEENLYEWSGGRLQLMSVIEEAGQSTAAISPKLGGLGSNVRHAISNNGSRVFWWGKNASGEKHLYMRDTVKDETVQIDTKQPGVPTDGNKEETAEFQSANAEGTLVFFTDGERLTEDAGASGGKPDLYVCEIVENAAKKLECELTDLTREEGGESANVQGLVLGTSEDGSYVYFVADGVLAPGATPGRCGLAAEPSVTCNLYVDHRTSGKWEMRFIASLSAADEPDWRPGETGKEEGAATLNLGRISADVSPNGRYLTFMSKRAQQLVGYDNRDTSEAAHEALDEEVFLFDAESGRPASESLVCASCDPSGGRPHGVYDPLNGDEEGPEGLGLLVDRPQTWEGHWLAGSIPSWTNIALGLALYQPRYLSNGGRLFFQSPADLVPEAVNGKEDVYEYEPEGIPHGQHRCASSSATFVAGDAGCVGLISSGTSAHESAFLDASQSGGEGDKESEEGGGDVFFVTEEKLVPEDTDGGFDVYDAHECTAASACIPHSSPVELPPCESTPECSKPASAGARLGDPASGTSSTGNYVPPAKSGNKGVTVKKPHLLTRAQKLARALEACHRLGHKQKRLACEKQAHKKYGAHKASHKAKKTGAKSGAAHEHVGGR